uniref:Uncharacterized protein n=1 Tax=Anopheles maculatus TaxID=74869 RepID=A0A182SQA7_9DIPT
EVHPATLQRSESYSPATASITLLPHHSQSHSHKRGLSQGGSLNFYKEIQLEGTESPPPPKLNRLNSAPAGGAPTALPFKIDILPNLPTAAGITSPTSSPLAKGTTAHTSGAITPQITYNFERLAATSPSTMVPASTSSLEPVIKLDYSNLRLPATSASPHGSSARSTVQPTIKIDLSSIANRTSPATPDSGTPRKHIEGGGMGKHYASPTTSTTPTTNPTVVQSPVATVAPPLFAALSSTIPGMDEDYDDI